MKRIPEEPLMENPLQARVYSEADFGETDLWFVTRLEELLLRISRKPCQHCVIVDLGCGPGNITEHLALQWPDASVIGVDGSTEMLKIACKRKFSSPNPVRQIDYRRIFLSSEQVNSSNLNSTADLLVSNSLLHHFPDPLDFWKVTKAIASPGAFVCHRDLLRPLDEEQVVMLLKKNLKNSHQILKDDYLASLRASFTVEEVEEQLLLEGLERFKVINLDDRYLEVSGEF